MFLLHCSFVRYASRQYGQEIEDVGQRSDATFIMFLSTNAFTGQGHGQNSDARVTAHSRRDSPTRLQ